MNTVFQKEKAANRLGETLMGIFFYHRNTEAVKNITVINTLNVWSQKRMIDYETTLNFRTEVQVSSPTENLSVQHKRK